MSEQNRRFQWQYDINNWALGIALILIGGLFLLDTFDILNINMANWWAVFILIPGLNMAANGWRRYQDSQSRHDRNTAVWGLLLMILAFTLFFNIAWSYIFPLALIGVGIYLFFFR